MTRKAMLSLLLGLVFGSAASAVTIDVSAGGSIQAAIDVAVDGDVVAVAPGTFVEDLDFKGKAIRVVGAGPASIIRGTGSGPVVTFASGEGPASVIDAFTITGGVADRGGGIFVQGSSPTIARNVLFDNRARLQGSAIYLHLSGATVHNNLIAYHQTALGDPHGVEIVDAAPEVINNTVVRGDSNGLIIRGNSPALVMNNIIAYNGLRVAGDRRGRGICDFSANGSARIQYNVFKLNNVAALLTGGRDFRRIRTAQREIAPPRLLGNVDGRPGFLRRRPLRIGDLDANAFSVADFALDLTRRGYAIDAGNPDPAFNDLDGTRNDAGFTGGPGALP